MTRLTTMLTVATLAVASIAHAGDTYSSIMKAHDAKQEQALAKLAAERYDALVTYTMDTKGADDMEKAHRSLVELAAELDRPGAVVEHADALAAAFPESKSLDAMMMLKADALGELGKVDAAVELMSGVASRAEGNNAVDAYFALADFNLAHDNVEGALAAYNDLKAREFGMRGLDDYVDGLAKKLEDIGKAPTAFPEVMDIAGKPLSLDDYKGKVVLIDFWATWCGPCIAELPNVLKTYEKYHDQGFEIVGISLDNADAEQKFKDFIAENGMTWRHHFDGKGWENEVAQAYGIKSIPATYLLDTEGKIVRVGLRGDALGETVGALLE